jgi:ABC-type Na+ efflux pump permease subunit
MNLTESQMLKIGVSIFAGLVVFIAIIVGIIIFKKKAADKAADDTIAADDEAADDTIAADDEAAAVKAAERAAAEKAAEKAAERAAAEKAAAEKAAAVKAAAEKAAADQAAEKAAADMVAAKNSDEKANTAIKNFNTAYAKRDKMFRHVHLFDIFVLCDAARAAILAEKETKDNNIVQQTLKIDDLLLYDSIKMYDKAKEDTRRAKELFNDWKVSPSARQQVQYSYYEMIKLQNCINELKN